ncbi:MAG TPA: hypothetical protein VFL80_10370 [Thermoanaerobaculia bacterium]|nr:hypothetical protein [Thermoanaerobaculia bacterium]
MPALRWRFPERRSGTRILTLKNAVWVLAGMLALFVVYSAYNEHRRGAPAGKRLYERGAKAPATQDVKTEVIEPSPVSDHTFATLPRSGLEGQSPSPMVGVSPPQRLEPARPAATPVARSPQPTLKETQQRGGRTVVTQDADGVRVDVKPSKAEQPEITTTTQAPVPPEQH